MAHEDLKQRISAYQHGYDCGIKAAFNYVIGALVLAGIVWVFLPA